MNDMARAPLTVHALTDEGTGAWEAFVERCEEATFFHRAGWRRVIEGALGHRCHYLLAQSGGQVRGVLPLVHVNSRLFGKSLVSNAFCVYGGPAAADSAARAALDGAAIDLARSLGVDHLEYRSPVAHRSDWVCRSDLYVTFRKPLDADPEKNLSAVPRKQRAMVRKGIARELRSEVDHDVARFFPVYAESVRNLGTPVLPKRFFAALKAEFGDACEILIVTAEGRPVASVLSFYFRDEVLPYYGGGVAAARSLAANDFMYWSVMKQACDRGCAVFDFGRSKRGTGSFDFKKNWGFQPTPLHYEYKLLRRSEMPNLNPLNPKFSLSIAMWKRLPLPIANALGPLLARQLA